MKSNMPIEYSQYFAQAEELCRQNNATLLFLTLFGSSLYGTQSPGKSDIDIRGIFLPSMESLQLNEAPKSLHYSTGNNERRNTAHDVDIDLWSVQHWLLKLLPTGDTGALDVLFAPSNTACTLFRSPVLNEVFANPLKLMDTSSGRAYAEYSLGQAKKYGIKGSRIGALRRVWHWLDEQNGLQPQEKLLAFIEDIALSCADERFCYAVETREGNALHLCGKTHMGSIRMEEFSRRVQLDMQRYGARAMEAERNEGLDFKALSHAVRALYQMKELLLTGKIIFPLQKCEELRAIKEGRFSWLELEPYILERLAAVDALREKAPYCGVYEPDFAKRCILSCYAEKPQGDTQITGCFTQGFSIPTGTHKAILQKLADAEQTHDVKIIYACESGSRGWGFASEDSDFDVRFIYVHKPEWYLGVAPEENRDVLELGIEQTPVGELDINGWELRKALKLFRQSNPPLFEWLSSPLVYQEAGSLAQTLRKLAPDVISPLRSWHHYNSLMKKSRARYWEKWGSIKAWFYVMRPLMAMQWLEQGMGVPPMRFDLLMDGVVSEPKLRKELDALVALKCSGVEGDLFTPPKAIERYVENLAQKAQEAPDLPVQEGRVDFDAVFRGALREIWGEHYA